MMQPGARLMKLFADAHLKEDFHRFSTRL